MLRTAAVAAALVVTATAGAATPSQMLAAQMKGNMQAYYDKAYPGLKITTVTCTIARAPDERALQGALHVGEAAGARGVHDRGEDRDGDRDGRHDEDHRRDLHRLEDGREARLLQVAR